MTAVGSRDSLSVETSSVKDVPNPPYLDYEQLVLNSNKEGMDFLRKGQYKQAFEQLKYAEAVVVSKQGKDEPTNLMSVTCNNLGCYYKKVGKLHAALSYLRKALKIEVSLQTDDVTVAGTHLNVCAILSKLDKHDKALQHALCALELISSRVNAEGTTQDEYSVLAIAYHNVAVERDYLHQLQEAAAAYQQGHQVAKKCLGDQHPLTQTLAKNANAAVQKCQAKAEAERERERPRREEGRQKTVAQAPSLPEIRSKGPTEPSHQETAEEVSRDPSWNWSAAPKGSAPGFLPPLSHSTSLVSKPLQAVVPETASTPSFVETMGPEVRATPPSPPPLVMEQRPPPEERQEVHPEREPRRPRGDAPKRPNRTRPPAAPVERDDAGLVPAAQQSQLLRKSAAEKIQHYWREHHRHKAQNRDQAKLEHKAAIKLQAIWRAFAVRRRKNVKATVAIQRHLRGFLVRIALRRHKAAVIIQRHGMGFLTRKNLKQAVEAAVRIQRVARARMAKVTVEARRLLVQRGAQLVRAAIRTWMCRHQLSELKVVYDKEQARQGAATQIQSVWRGRGGRQLVASRRSERRKRIAIFKASAKMQA
ncbi:unnamed protein product, partial [Effrenium voratum]